MSHGQRVRPRSDAVSAKLARQPVNPRRAEPRGGTLGAAEARWENEGGAMDGDELGGRKGSALRIDTVLNGAACLHSGALHRDRG